MSKFSTTYFNQDTEIAERFIEGSFNKNPNISNFGEFKTALYEYLSLPQGRGAYNYMDEDDVIDLFERAKGKIRENVSDEEFEELYGDGNKVQRIAISPTQKVTITYPKVKSKSYKRKGKTIKSYERFKPRKFSNAEIKFLQVRKQRKLSTKKIISDYNRHFKNNPRSASSISTKLYRN